MLILEKFFLFISVYFFDLKILTISLEEVNQA